MQFLQFQKTLTSIYDFLNNQSQFNIKVAALLGAIFIVTFYFNYSRNEVLFVSSDYCEAQKKEMYYETLTCTRLLEGDKNLLKYYRNSNNMLVPEKPASFYADLSENDELCAVFKNKYPYTLRHAHTTDDELEFPIAFSFAVFNDIDHFARLLRIMYRPHNVYVVHVDRKASKEYKSAVEGIRKCLGERNIHILPPDFQVDVKWACFTALLCHFNSMKYLIENNITAFNGKDQVHWKYYINLSGQEFPLRTNYEIVQILRALDNRNHMELDQEHDWSHRIPPKNSQTMDVKYEKGFVYIMVTREFCEFAVKNKRAKAVYDALKSYNSDKCLIADEIIFQTLQFNPHLGTPGGCYQNPKIYGKNTKKYYRRMYSIWEDKNCHSYKRVRDVCIFGVDDLPFLMKDHSYVIANKFHSYFQPAAYDCMEVMLSERAEKQQKSLIDSNENSILVDLKPYKNNPICL